MVIVSMCTESYADWLYHFLHGLKENTDEKILINLINFSEKSEQIVRDHFPDVIFRNVKINLIPKETHNFEKKVFKVTYLKGRFIHDAFKKYREPVLWIDITALIRAPINGLMDKFSGTDILLMRRNFDEDFGKGVYAAEIFGLNNEKEILDYYRNCEKRNKEWFSDQFALCEIQGKREYIPFGEWSNFYYEPNAKSWSDRGKTGKGKIESDDTEWTHNKFIEDLENKFPGYRQMFENFRRQFFRKKILIYTDAKDWCYCNTVKEIMKNPEFDFTVIYDIEKQSDELMSWHGDLVWARCGSYRHKKLLDRRPDLKDISFSTITTGGESLLSRFSKQTASNQGEAGVIVQNESARFLVDQWIKKTNNGMKCFVLPNGVNCEMFSAKEHSEERDYIVGFVGRTKESTEKDMKGFYYAKQACDIEGLRMKIASNTPETEVSFDSMPEFYQRIDCLILPSDSEGCSNTINEAMASGLPVITCKKGWHGENCTDQVVFIDRDVKMAVLALKCLREPKLRKELGKRARKFAEEHSWPNLMPYYTEVFNAMIEQAKHNKKIPVPKKIQELGTNDFIVVEALKKISLGKIRKNGEVVWFTPGMRRKLPNDDLHRPIIEREVNSGFLKIIK